MLNESWLEKWGCGKLKCSGNCPAKVSDWGDMDWTYILGVLLRLISKNYSTQENI